MESQIELFLRELNYDCNHPKILSHFPIDSVAVSHEVLDGVQVVYVDLIGCKGEYKDVWLTFTKDRLVDLVCLYTVWNFGPTDDGWQVWFCVITEGMINNVEQYKPYLLEIRYRDYNEDLA